MTTTPTSSIIFSNTFCSIGHIDRLKSISRSTLEKNVDRVEQGRITCRKLNSDPLTIRKQQRSKCIKKVVDNLGTNVTTEVLISSFKSLSSKISKYFDDFEDFSKMYCNYNHKIVSIEHHEYETPQNVYCLSILNDSVNTNFSLGNGVVVKNCDADPAGKFIGALLLGFFSMYLRPWIDEGLVYVLQSPLYRQNGKFFFDDVGLDKSKPFTRFKGLGELSKDDVKETLIHNRRLVKVTSEDLDKALKLIINTNNERKALSVELGILVGKEEFLGVIDQTQVDILGNIDDLVADDEDTDDTDPYEVNNE